MTTLRIYLYSVVNKPCYGQILTTGFEDLGESDWEIGQYTITSHQTAEVSAFNSRKELMFNAGIQLLLNFFNSLIY